MKNNYFSKDVIQAVWEKGKIVPGFNPNLYRKDRAGAWMYSKDYGNTNSLYGWEIDHIVPQSQGGIDNLSNLQPLQWNNNREKGDDYPHYKTTVIADGTKNIAITQNW